MTESEAWLKIAEMFESPGPTWRYFNQPITGICDSLKRLWVEESVISHTTEREMFHRLAKHFNPNGRNPAFEFFWDHNRRRSTRTLRATACCFLAAMSQ